MPCCPLCHSLPLPIKVNVVADERDLYRYVFQSFRIFVKACERSAAAGGGSPRGVDADSREEGDTCRYMDGPLLSEVLDAMAAALHDLVVAFMRVEEATDRYERRGCSPMSLGWSSGSSTRSVSETMAPLLGLIVALQPRISAKACFVQGCWRSEVWDTALSAVCMHAR